MRRSLVLLSATFKPPSTLPLPVLVISEVLFLVEQICSRRSQVYNLWAPVAVLLQLRAFVTIVTVGYPFATADDALVLVVSEGTFVADTRKSGRADIAVTHGAFAIAFIAETSDGDAGLLAAHDEIGMMARHDERELRVVKS